MYCGRLEQEAKRAAGEEKAASAVVECTPIASRRDTDPESHNNPKTTLVREGTGDTEEQKTIVRFLL